MKIRIIAAMASITLGGCGGSGSGGTIVAPTPTPTVTPTPTPTPSPTPAPVSFFQGVTHFDNFARADTTIGTVSAGPQGQTYEVFSDFLNAPDAISQIKGGRFFMPPSTGPIRASYVMATASNTVKRIGLIARYSENTIAPKGGYGYIWAIILSTKRERFTDEMIHFTGSRTSWRIELWHPNGSRRSLATGPITPNITFNNNAVIDMKLSGTTAIVSVNGSTSTVTDADLAAFVNARRIVFEHFVNGATQDINEFPAWYYQVEGSPAANPALYTPFEP